MQQLISCSDLIKSSRMSTRRRDRNIFRNYKRLARSITKFYTTLKQSNCRIKSDRLAAWKLLVHGWTFTSIWALKYWRWLRNGLTTELYLNKAFFPLKLTIFVGRKKPQHKQRLRNYINWKFPPYELEARRKRKW